jgi:dihydropyrimidinase
MMMIASDRIVTPAGVVAGRLVVRDGRIAAVEPGGDGPHDCYDARGCLVLPGGVDPHAHALTDLGAASRSAAFGGTTTILTFTLPEAGEAPLAAFERARDALVPASHVDIGLHGSYFDPDGLTPALLQALRAGGATGAQVFLAFPELGLMFGDGQLYRALRDAAAAGLPLQVQCENGPLVDALTAELVAAGETGLAAYPRSRPGPVEDEAVERVLAIAALAHAPVYLVHLSTAIAVERARAARAAGAYATVEACTHHLVLDDGVYARPGAHRFVVGPPLRPPGDVEALWAAVRDGTVETVGSDHSHMPLPADPAPADFREAPMGLPGIGARVPLVLSEGLRRGIAPERLAQVLATGPARAFGLARKGALVAGADADVLVWDPEVRGAIGDLRDGLGHSPYAGMPVEGALRLVLLRGEAIARDGELVDGVPAGRFVRPS